MKSVDVSSVVNESKFSRYHRVIVFWCCLLVFFDGIELGLIGAVATPIMGEWSLEPVQFGTVSSYSALGMILGALIFGPLADRISRKNTILISALIYSFFTLMGAFAQGIIDFSVYRFIAGIGMGGIVPTTLGLITDISPRKNRAYVATFLTTFIGVGALIAGLISIYLIPAFGWRSIFIVGGLPIITIPFLIKLLPESPIILYKKGRFEELANLLNRLSSNKEFYSGKDKYEMLISVKTKVPFMSLFQNKEGSSTLLIWIAFFCSYLVSFGLNAWLPNIMVRAGYPLTSGLLFAVVMGLGAMIGSLTGGKIAGQLGLKKVVIWSFILGGIPLCLLSINFGSAVLLYSIFFIVGWGTIGSQNLLLAFCSQLYPSEIRSTGLASASIIGRLGSFTGPLFGGIILSLNVPLNASFVAFGIVALIASISVMGVRSPNSRSNVNTAVNTVTEI